MKKNRLLVLLFVWLLVAGVILAFSAEDKIIAVVNKDVITRKDFDSFANFMRMQLSQTYRGEELEKKIASLESDLMERLIEDRLILQEAKKSGIRINNDKVRARIEQIKRSYPSESEFQGALKQQGLSQNDIETKIREQLLMYSIIEVKIKSKIIINPSEVTQYYQENKDKLRAPEQREFQAFTTDNEDLARKVSSALRNNEDPAGLSERYGVAANKLSAYADGQLRKEVQDIVFKLKPQEVSAPAKINNKYYVFKLEGVTAAREESLAEAQDKIYNILLEKKMQQGIAAWIVELKKQAYLKVYRE